MEESHAESNNSIIVDSLVKSYGNLKVLNGISFSVGRGEILALLGPNGAGKTTTVKILSTLIRPDQGRITINGFDLMREANDVRRSMGLTGQYAAVDEYLTGRENLEMIGRLYRLKSDFVKQKTQELLKRLDLSESANRPVKTYSGGMRRRIDLAMSLIASPSVLVLDEPTTGLDPRSRLEIWKIIKELAESDISILLTTQYMEEADYLSDRIIVIDKGAIIAEGSAPELKAKVGSDHMEFIIAREGHLDKASQVLNLETMHVDISRRSLKIPTKNGAKDLKRILDQLEASDIEIESLSLHRPTLDDVFLSITGHTTETNFSEKDTSKT